MFNNINNTINFFIKNHLILKKINKKVYIYCTIRKKFFLFKKEEVVRQYIIFLLKKVKKYKEKNIVVEFSIYINKYLCKKRIDILVKSNNNPYILIECKSLYTTINKKTFDQILIYNKYIKSPFLMISNGLKSYILKTNKQQKIISSLNFIP
ncbi:type I restriction enzyme HsdR N-terminal domain-containing protein [Blattabacterium cuenoti]|uniref:type I restriction enzyme HsdR N-terminal domain-containing protein n=1 Tax=Blattabacterium cuenoti TaxID=1653831 RepID=UPI001EEC217E|nr:type I restriction enzyme HsdR N-terminal domain-containing protein [Blattabacterium cuenoti]